MTVHYDCCYSPIEEWNYADVRPRWKLQSQIESEVEVAMSQCGYLGAKV